jgi:hypothetical protein
MQHTELFMSQKTNSLIQSDLFVAPGWSGPQRVFPGTEHPLTSRFFDSEQVRTCVLWGRQALTTATFVFVQVSHFANGSVPQFESLFLVIQALSQLQFRDAQKLSRRLELGGVYRTSSPIILDSTVGSLRVCEPNNNIKTDVNIFWMWIGCNSGLYVSNFLIQISLLCVLSAQKVFKLFENKVVQQKGQTGNSTVLLW